MIKNNYARMLPENAQRLGDINFCYHECPQSISHIHWSEDSPAIEFYLTNSTHLLYTFALSLVINMINLRTIIVVSKTLHISDWVMLDKTRARKMWSYGQTTVNLKRAIHIRYKRGDSSFHNVEYHPNEYEMV